MHFGGFTNNGYLCSLGTSQDKTIAISMESRTACWLGFHLSKTSSSLLSQIQISPIHLLEALSSRTLDEFFRILSIWSILTTKWNTFQSTGRYKLQKLQIKPLKVISLSVGKGFLAQQTYLKFGDLMTVFSRWIKRVDQNQCVISEH